MDISKNISHFKYCWTCKGLYIQTHTARTSYPCKLGTYCGLSMSREVAKTENVHTHPPVVELVLTRTQTHTRAHSQFILIHCDSPPWAEHNTPQLVISSPVCTIAQHKAIFCCCYTAPCFRTNKKALQWSCFVCVRFPSISTCKFLKMSCK
jgi:hypothetical protein